MAKSQNAFIKKQKEREKAKRKKEKQEKKEERRQKSTGGAEVDWDSAPVNKTLTQEEKQQRAANENYNS